ncbi:porin [Dechloromonas sp. ARDL1]|uniref:porin n=1 Tax=Dechloromonas sp. ARDL1 TaxID=3322121 RepID=UPI003DA790CE
MQKKIVALAVAALASSAAFAQTNVTVYGVVDLGQSFVKSSGTPDSQATVGRLDSNSSHIGFKGVEDLGNGLKAVFQYETGFNADVAGALAGGRDTFVGLTGGFGTVVAGNLTHPLRAMGAKVELAPGATGLGTTMSVTGTILGLQTGADNRASNAIAYVSPSFGGVTGTVAYINGERQANGAGQAETRAYQLAVQYDNGPLYVAAGYHASKNGQWAAALPAPFAALNGVDEADARIYRLAAVYTLPTQTKLTALFDNTKVEGALGGEYLKRNAWSIGAAQSFGKNTIGLEYGRSGQVKDETGSLDGTKSNIWTALYTYELSKRTSVQARYSKLNNQENTANNFYINPVNNGAPVAAGADYTGYMVGLRHAF